MTSALRERVITLLLSRGGLVALVAAGLYLWVAPPHIIDGDNAEFSTLGAIGGTAHPTGYPLYLLWLRAMQWLPGQTPAHTAALATALLAAATILVLHAACRAWGARPLGATLAAAIFAGAPVVLRTSTEAEVFALNNLVVVTVLWLSAAAGPLRGIARVAALALVAGLGLSNHMTCVLLAPVGLLGAVRGVRETTRPRVLAVAAGVGAFALGLVPYVYLLVTPSTPLSWGKVATLGDLVAYVTRADYGGPGAFLPTGQDVSAVSQLAALGTMLARSWLGVGAAAALAMLGWRSVRRTVGERDASEPRWGWWMLTASFLLAGPILVARFNLDPADDLNLYVCQRFYMLPSLLLAIPLSCAVNLVDARISGSRFGERGVVAIVATVGLMGAASLSLRYVGRIQTPALERYIGNMIRPLPENAVVFIGRDEEFLGAGYLQWALGERQDVTIVAHQLARLPWYKERIAARGIVAPAGDDEVILRVIDGLLASGRPVFVEKSRVEVIVARPAYPWGPLMRVLPKDQPLPSLPAVVIENQELYSRYVFGYPRPGSRDEFASAVHRRYAATWNTLAKKLDEAGDHESATRARAYAAELAPRP
jgi:hypothetical protein